MDKFPSPEVKREENIKVPEVKKFLEQTKLDLDRPRSESAAKKETIYSGFENDPDFAGIKDLVEQVFGKEKLAKSLISKIIYFSKCSHVYKDGDNIYLPESEYAEKIKTNPSLFVHNRRADNFGRSNFKDKYKNQPPVPMPIAVYSFYSKNLEGHNYLNDVPPEEKMKVYKIGTVFHEVAHSIYDFALDEQGRKAWNALIKKRGEGLTEYSDKYYQADQRSEMDKRFTEEFSEAIRLFATRNEYLKKISPEIYKFISQLNIGQIES